jgi:hypothetical protein
VVGSNNALQIATSTLVPVDNTSTSNNNNNNSNFDPYRNWMNIQCRICSDTGPEGNARAFVMGPSPLSIVVCQNRLMTTTTTSSTNHTGNHDLDSFRSRPTSSAALEEMEEILTHELVHVHDVRALALNLLECQNLAYSEIRAAKYAECDIRPNNTLSHRQNASSSNPFYLIRGGGGNNQHQQRACVKAKAIQATRNLFGERRARECVNAAFESAYGDDRPFGRSVGGGVDETTNHPSTTRETPWETEHSSR